MKLATQNKIVYGVELPYEVKERYGSDLLYPDHCGPERAGTPVYPNRQPTGTVIETGTVFVPMEILEELQEADHSLGMGGAYLINSSKMGLALEQAGLARQETRGGYYTRTEERVRLAQVLNELYEQMPH